jgi:hypothetical protein
MTEALNVSPQHVQAQYTENITSALIQDAFAVQACKKIIIGIGPWDASWIPQTPTLFPEFEQSLTKVLEGLATSSLLSPDLFFGPCIIIQ